MRTTQIAQYALRLTYSQIGIRDSKFGEALVFVVRPTSGGYVLGFKADPRERLRPLLSELQILHRAYNEKPVFGLEVNWSNEDGQTGSEMNTNRIRTGLTDINCLHRRESMKRQIGGASSWSGVLNMFCSSKCNLQELKSTNETEQKARKHMENRDGLENRVEKLAEVHKQGDLKIMIENCG